MSSFEEVEKRLRVVDYLQRKERDEAKYRNLKDQLEGAMQKIRSLEEDSKKKDDLIATLNSKAYAKEETNQRRAMVLAEDLVKERLPAAVEDGVRREIAGYPYNCSEPTKNAFNLASRDLYDRVIRGSWWAPLLFAPAATNPTPKATVTPKILTVRAIPIQKKQGQDQAPSTSTQSIQLDRNGKPDNNNRDTANSQP